MPSFCVTGQNGSGEDPGPVIHGCTVQGKVDGARDENAAALRVNVVQICKEEVGKEDDGTRCFKTIYTIICIRAELHVCVLLPVFIP